MYEELSLGYVKAPVGEGKMVSLAFTVWQGEGLDRKGRFVVNFKRQSKHWPRGSVKMETITAFAVDLQRDDQLMSWDIQSGYRHFYLHPAMRDMFMFRYDSRYYRCIALPFGWGRFVLWFTQLQRPLVQYVKEKCAYRVVIIWNLPVHCWSVPEGVSTVAVNYNTTNLCRGWRV